MRLLSLLVVFGLSGWPLLAAAGPTVPPALAHTGRQAPELAGIAH
jgi:hypothetical protein